MADPPNPAPRGITHSLPHPTEHRHLLRIRADFVALARALDLTREQRQELRQFEVYMARYLRARGRATRATGDETVAPAPVPAPVLKPVTTLVSMLPNTPYKETEEAEGTVNSPAYVKVQLALLEYLGKHPSEKLTARQACHWTERIADDKQPNAKDALRLCYYMRSQGFDTYAEVQDGSISLYISNQAPEVRGTRRDMLYWKQNYATNAIEHATSDAYNASQGARMHGFIPSAVSIRDLLAHTQAASRQRRAQDDHAEDGDIAPAPEGDQAQEGDRAEEDVEPTEDNLATRIAAASADLEALLLAGSQDTE
jgi:hypothetical protein